MPPTQLLLASCLLFGVSSLYADDAFPPIHGDCTVTVSTQSDRLELLIQSDTCTTHSRRDGDTVRTRSESGHHCTSNMQTQIDAFSGFVQADLGREGAHIDAAINAEAGSLVCSGTIHGFKLAGNFTFTPNVAFAAQLVKLGILGLDSQTLESYTLFHVERAWVQSLIEAGVQGPDFHTLDANKLLSLKIFKVDAPFVTTMRDLGYPTPNANKLLSLKIHGVNPKEVRQIRALGYQPTLDQLIQMRIFKVTPDFISSMKQRGFKDLTLAKLVQIRTFNLDQ